MVVDQLISSIQVLNFNWFPGVGKGNRRSVFGPRYSAMEMSPCNQDYWMMDTGYSILDAGYWILDTGYWILDTRYWILDAGCWILDTRYLMLDTRYWILDTRYLMLDTGCWMVVARYRIPRASSIEKTWGDQARGDQARGDQGDTEELRIWRLVHFTFLLKGLSKAKP